MRRTKEEAARTREDIFSAGIKVFARKGYTAGTLSDVAREAGVTRGAIYWHFRNKEAFFQEMVTRLSHAYDDLINRAITSGRDPVHAIELAIQQIVTRFVTDPDFRTMQELLMTTTLEGEEICELEMHRMVRDETMAVTVIEEAIRRHQLYDQWTPVTALHAIEAMIFGTFMMIRNGKLNPTEEEISHLAAFVRRGIAPVPQGARI